MQNFDWNQYSVNDILKNWLMAKAEGFPSSPAQWWKIIYEGFSTNTRWWTTGEPGVAITLDDGSLLAPVALGGSSSPVHPVCFLRRVGKVMYIYARAGDSADNAARSAHKSCWQWSPSLDGAPNEDWAHK